MDMFAALQRHSAGEALYQCQIMTNDTGGKSRGCGTLSQLQHLGNYTDKKLARSRFKCWTPAFILLDPYLQLITVHCTRDVDQNRNTLSKSPTNSGSKSEFGLGQYPGPGHERCQASTAHTKANGIKSKAGKAWGKYSLLPMAGFQVLALVGDRSLDYSLERPSTAEKHTIINCPPASNVYEEYDHIKVYQKWVWRIPVWRRTGKPISTLITDFMEFTISKNLISPLSTKKSTYRKRRTQKILQSLPYCRK
nr:uncharacterized protein LOC125623739 [Caretta caretta]